MFPLSKALCRPARRHEARRPLLEVLEDRLAPATLSVLNGVLTYNASIGAQNFLSIEYDVGTARYTLADSGDPITIGSGVVGAVRLDRNTVSFSTVGIASAVLNVRDQQDYVRLLGVAHPLTVNPGAGIDFTVIWQPRLLAPVTVNSQGDDALSIGETGSGAADDHFTLTRNRVSLEGHPSVTFTGNPVIYLNTTRGNDTVDVESLQASARVYLFP